MIRLTTDPLLAELFGSAARSALLAVEQRQDRIGAIVRKILASSVWVDRGSIYGPCLEWTAGDSGKPGRGQAKGRGHSYARMTLDGCTCAVHRVLWATLNGYLPAKKQLDHLCGNRRCVIHCEAVTHKQNQRRRDRARKQLLS